MVLYFSQFLPYNNPKSQWLTKRDIIFMLSGPWVSGSSAHQGWVQLGRISGFWLGLVLAHEVSVILGLRLKGQHLPKAYPFHS